MFLKNYTSNVPVSETVYNIEKVLIKCGVSGITKEYGTNPGDVVAVVFHIKTGPDSPTFTVRLPVDKKKCLDALWMDYAGDDKLSPDCERIFWNARKKKTRKDFVEQANRTAWKIVQDWVEVQMSMIQTRQADFVQVFLPYLCDGDKTIYQRAIERGGVQTLMLRNGEKQ